jgi:hypothetical protein
VRIIIECPENILHLEAGYIYADCLFDSSILLQSGGGPYIIASPERLQRPLRADLALLLAHRERCGLLSQTLRRVCRVKKKQGHYVPAPNQYSSTIAA